MTEREHVFDKLARRARRRAPTGTFSPWVVRGLELFVARIVRLLWRPVATGWENLPDEGAYLIVANHSASGAAESLVLATLWLERFENQRPVAPMVHALAYAAPGIGDLLGSIGAIPSTRSELYRALEEGIPVLIFPGGDHESFRPIWQANQVDLAGRRGFLRAARAADVPIVPLGIQGSHYTVPFLWRTSLLPKFLIWPMFLGVKRMPIGLLNVALASLTCAWIAPLWGWGWAALGAILWIYAVPLWWFPWVPWKIKMRFGEPLSPAQLFSDRDTDDDVSGAYERVEGTLQRLVDELASE